MITTRSTLSRQHDEFVAEIGEFASQYGCSFEGNPAYHDRLPVDQVDRLKIDYSAAGLAERLRCDKRLINNKTGLHVCVEAKTSHRTDGPVTYLFEAYQIGLHKALRDGCLYAVRKVVGDFVRDCGFYVTNDFGSDHITEIRIPDLIQRGGSVVSRRAGECQDGESFYRDTFSEWFPGVEVTLTNTANPCRGSGDPYAVMDDDFMHSNKDWRSLVHEFAYSF